MEFLVVAHKNEPQDLWKLLGEDILINISIIIIMKKKYIENKLFPPPFMTKIIIRNPIQFSVPRAMHNIWKTDNLLIKKGNNILNIFTLISGMYLAIGRGN